MKTKKGYIAIWVSVANTVCIPRAFLSIKTAQKALERYAKKSNEESRGIIKEFTFGSDVLAREILTIAL